MQINIETTGALERTLQFGIPAAEVDSKIQQKLAELGRTVKLKGFRPGKVPLTVIRQRYGKQVREEVMQTVMQQGLGDAIQEGELRVAALKSLQPEEQEQGSDMLSFSAQLEVFPELDTLNVEEVEIKRPVVDINDSDVDEMLNTLQEQRRVWKPADGPADEMHRVLVEYNAMVGEQRIPEEGNLRIGTIIGSGIVFEQLEQAITGMQAGDSKTAELTFPEDFRAPQLAGKQASVELHVTHVETGELPEVDDAFAASFGIAEGGVEKLREEVLSNLDREKNIATRRWMNEQVGKSLTEKHADMELPASLVQQEAANLRQRMQQEIEQSGGDISQLPPVDTLLDSARVRVRGSILLGELARQNDIKLDENRVYERIAEIASTYDEPQQVVELYRSNEQLYGQVRQSVLEEQVVDWVVEHAACSDVPMAFKDLMNGTQDA